MVLGEKIKIRMGKHEAIYLVDTIFSGLTPSMRLVRDDIPKSKVDELRLPKSIQITFINRKIK